MKSSLRARELLNEVSGRSGLLVLEEFSLTSGWKPSGSIEIWTPKDPKSHNAPVAVPIMSRELCRFNSIIPASLLLLICALPIPAMDRWTALSQIESGDDDTAVGGAGEISRYQMKPELWRRYAAPDAAWQLSADALVVAQKIMKARCADFETRFGRQPTDFEFYVLWNAPSQVDQPSRPVRERAERFSLLVRRR